MTKCEYVISDVIKTPAQAKVSTKGNERSVGHGIDVTVGYQNCLMKGPNSGLSAANLASVQAVCGKDAIGVVDIIQTKGSCKDIKTGEKVTRSYFVNTKPSCGTKSNPINCGIVAGIENDIMGISGIFESMFSFDTPECSYVEIKAVPGSSPECTNINKGGYLTAPDKKKAEAYAAEEGFQNRNTLVGHDLDMPSDPIIQIYYASVGLLMFYILLRVTTSK